LCRYTCDAARVEQASRGVIAETRADDANLARHAAEKVVLAYLSSVVGVPLTSGVLSASKNQAMNETPLTLASPPYVSKRVNIS
jgi:hypothetical protein